MKKMIFKNRFGLSLAEVVVTMGVIASTMIVGISVAGQSLRIAKENEVRNTSNEILIQGLELMKSPAPLSINTSLGSNSSQLEGSYKLENIETNEGGLELVFVSPTLGEIDTCERGSQDYSNYGLELSDDSLDMCYQIIFTSGEDDSYSIVTVVVYKLGADFETERLEIFRKGNFSINGEIIDDINIVILEEPDGSGTTNEVDTPLETLDSGGTTLQQ